MPSASKQSGSSSSKANDNTSAGQSSKGAGSQGGTGVSKEFTESYGLKFHDKDDYAEAKAIQQAFRDQDAKEAKQGGR